MGLRAARGAIAAAAGLARDHRGPQRVLGAPVGGIQGRVEEEAEDGVVFSGQVPGEASGVGKAARPVVEEPPQSVDVLAPRDGEATIGDVASAMAITCGERRAQQGVHLRGKRMMGMIQHHRAAAAEQMGQTRLVAGADKLPVRGPAVALQDAGEVGAEHGGRLRKAAPVLNRVDGRVWRHEGPQPLQVAADLPACFIGGHDGTAADPGAQRVVGRLRLPRRAVDGVHEAAAGHGQPETIPKQVGDLPEGEAELFVQDDREGHGVRAELHSRGAQRVRGLERMATLYTPMALRAFTDLDVKLAHDRALHREVFLILRDDATQAHPPVAVRTVRRQWRVMRDVDPGRRRPMGAATVGTARLAAWPVRIGFRQAPRERRGLSVGAAARGFELFLQPLVLAPQTIAFDFRALQILAEPLDLPRLIVDDLSRIRRGRVLAPKHAQVMPDPRKKYKYGMLDRSFSEVNRAARTR